MANFAELISAVTLHSPFWRVVSAIVYGEFMLRMRRLSTMLTMLLLVGITYLMIPEPSSGMTLISVQGARVIYDSQSLAYGSAMLVTIFFGLAGFYLVRGRMAEDLRLRTGSILAATNISNFTFLFARWLANFSYLMALLLIFMLAMFVLHFLRAEGPFEPGVYVTVYGFLMIPSLIFVAACAVFADAVPKLMGKAGDVLYFFLWCGLLGLTMGSTVESDTAPVFTALHLFDFSGTSATFVRMFQMFGSTESSVGIADFNTALTPIVMPESLMNGELMLYRVGSALLAPLPLLLALPFFHRYSPDKVKVQSKRSWDLLALANRLATPVRHVLKPLLTLAARLPFPLNIVLADAGLTLLSQPFASLLLLLGFAAGWLVPAAQSGGLLLLCVAVWGIMIADLSTREHETNTRGLQAGAVGGIRQLALRSWSAAMLIIAVVLAPLLLKLALVSNLAFAVGLSGVIFVASSAVFLGTVTGTARTFVALFLFALYLSVNISDIPAFDFLGFHGQANALTALSYAISAALLMLSTQAFVYRQARK